ncbi:MAG: hypothetical protein HY722_06905 [Planctomycetes bacterium]|nr:hypothetical protein [Planctomycetota bacterium]
MSGKWIGIALALVIVALPVAAWACGQHGNIAAGMVKDYLMGKFNAANGVTGGSMSGTGIKDASTFESATRFTFNWTDRSGQKRSLDIRGWDTPSPYNHYWVGVTMPDGSYYQWDTAFIGGWQVEKGLSDAALFNSGTYYSQLTGSKGSTAIEQWFAKNATSVSVDGGHDSSLDRNIDAGNAAAKDDFTG